MNPVEFLKTIYLGDRGCKCVTLDGCNSRVLIQVNLISRIRSASGNWEFDSKEDIEDGWIVFTDVLSIDFHPPGFIPNDFLDLIEAEPICLPESDTNPDHYLFRVQVGSVDAKANNTEVTINIRARGIHLEDPLRPTVEITE